MKFQFIVFCSILGLLFYSCQQNDIKDIKKVTKKRMPVATSYNLSSVFSDSAKLKVVLNTPLRYAYDGEDAYFEMPKGLTALFYDNNNQTTNIKADYGIRYEKKQIIELRKNVVVVNVNNDTLNTEHMIWNQKDRKIYCDGFVKITNKNNVIFGDSLIAKEDFSQYKLLNTRGKIDTKQ